MRTRRIAGRYELLEQLGASTWRAADTELQRDVLVQVPARDVAVARLTHPGIVQVFDQGVEDGEPYAVFEYLPGGSLEQRLAAGSLTEAEARAGRGRCLVRARIRARRGRDARVARPGHDPARRRGPGQGDRVHRRRHARGGRARARRAPADPRRRGDCGGRRRHRRPAASATVCSASCGREPAPPARADRPGGARSSGRRRRQPRSSPARRTRSRRAGQAPSRCRRRAARRPRRSSHRLRRPRKGRRPRRRPPRRRRRSPRPTTEPPATTAPPPTDAARHDRAASGDDRAAGHDGAAAGHDRAAADHRAAAGDDDGGGDRHGRLTSECRRWESNPHSPRGTGF